MTSPSVVVVGAATRDIHPTDPRGWLMGGGVTYGAVALARLGLRVGVLLGIDPVARGAREVEALRAAGADVHEVPLERGPVFLNEERPNGRVQTCGSPSDPIPPAALPRAWRDACAWMLVPVAAEIPPEWATVPRSDALVAFAWQGNLRRLVAGERVTPILPQPSPLLERADIVAVSRHDLPHELDLRVVGSWLGARTRLLLTAGSEGGLMLRLGEGRVTGGRHYPAIASGVEIDATGAGDTMLAGLVAARVATGSGRTDGASRGRGLRVGAAAASLLVEGPGIDSVPTLAQLRARVTRAVRDPDRPPAD